jgi:uncharacterized protein (DUF2249 family)
MVCGLNVLARTCAAEGIENGEEVWKVRVGRMGWVSENEDRVDCGKNGDVTVGVVSSGFAE